MLPMLFWCDPDRVLYLGTSKTSLSTTSVVVKDLVVVQQATPLKDMFQLGFSTTCLKFLRLMTI